MYISASPGYQLPLKFSYSFRLARYAQCNRNDDRNDDRDKDASSSTVENSFAIPFHRSCYFVNQETRVDGDLHVIGVDVGNNRYH